MGVEVRLAGVGDGSEFPELVGGEIQREQELFQGGKCGLVGGMEVSHGLSVDLLAAGLEAHRLESGVSFQFLEAGFQKFVGGDGGFWCA